MKEWQVKKQIVIKSLLSLIIVACGSNDSSYETQAVRDRVRILGLEVQDDGLYRFKLCRIHKEYTPQILAEECINPLITADGQEKVFTAIPRKPNTAVAHVRNWGLASFVGITAGIISYRLGRYIVKTKQAREMIGKAMEVRLVGNTDQEIVGNVDKVRSATNIKLNDEEQKLLTEVSEDKGLLKRIANNKIKDDDIEQLIRVEELTKRKLVEMGDKYAKLEVDELAIKKGAAQAELAQLETKLTKLKELENPNEKQLREIQKLQISIHEVQNNLNGARFKTIDELIAEAKVEGEEAKNALDERLTLWKNEYSNKFDSKLTEIKEAMGKPSAADDVAPKKDETVKIALKKQQKFYQKFLDRIDAGFRGFAKKFKGFPYISSKKYSKTHVVQHNKVLDEVIKSIDDDRPIKAITVESGITRTAGQLTGLSAFIALPLTAVSRHLPGHALLTANDSWSAVTSDLSSKHSTSVRVEDIATILDGIAQATGCKVSNKARTFAF